jgi:hypothetical protein
MMIFRDLDVCSILKNPSELASYALNYARSVYPKMVHNCPFRTGEKFDINYTFSDNSCRRINVEQKPTFDLGKFWLPDGDYKVSVTGYDDLDTGNLNYYFKMNTGDQNRF